ncbi:MAG: translocation/assembly module TamB [Treponema sp.]|jgi:hypothetical protein|nr:translocation/assembly module TamB [Treponema sp.]
MASERIVWEDRVPQGTGLNVRPLGGSVSESWHGGPPVFRILSILVFAVLLILAFLALRPVSAALTGRMELLRDELLGRGEELIGRRIEYESLGPSFLGGLDIRSLKILGKGSAPLFSASRFHLSWSLWDLLRKEGGAIRGLRIDKPELYVDPRLDRDLPELLSRLKELALSGGENGISLDVFSFRIRDGNFRVEGIGSLSSVDMDAEIRGGRIEAQGDLDAKLRPEEGFFAGLSSPAAPLSRLFGTPLNLSAAGRFRLSGETDLSGGKVFLSLPLVEEDRFRIAGLELNLELKDRVLSLNNESPGMAGPFNAALDYGLDTGELSARLSCRNYSPAGALRFLGPWKDYNRFLALRASGEAAFGCSPEGVFDYRADLSGFIPPNLPLANSGFSVKMAGRGDHINVDRLDLNLARGGAGAGGALSFRGGVDIRSLDFNGTLGLTDLSFTGDGGIDTLLTVRSRGKDVKISADRLKIGEAEFNALEMDLVREAGGLSFAASVLRFHDAPDLASGTAPAGTAKVPAPGESGDLPGIEAGEELLLAGLSSEGFSAVKVSGTFDYDPRYLETRFTLDSFSARDLAEIIRPLAAKFELPHRLPPIIPRLWENALQNTLVTTEVFVSTDFDQLLYNAPRLVISYSGHEGLIALFSVSGTDRRFTVDGGQLLWKGGGVQLTGQSDFSDMENISFSLDAAYRDVNYHLEGALLERRSLIVQGSYGFYGFIVSLGEGTYSGQIKGENIPVQFGERIGRSSFDLTMGYRSSESWFFELSGLELADFVNTGGSLENGGLLKLSARMDQSQILLRDIYFDDSLGALKGGGTFSPAANGEYRGNLSIFDDEHRESYTVDLSWVQGDRGGNGQNGAPPFLEDVVWPVVLDFWYFLSPESERGPRFQGRVLESPHIKLRVSGVGMRLSRFFRRLPNIRVDGILDLDWESLTQFNAGLNIYSLGVASGGQEIRAGGQAYIDGRGFRAENLRLGMGGLETFIPRLRLSMDESRMEGSGRIQGSLAGRELGVDFSVNSRFAPMDSWLDYAAALEDLYGAVELEHIVIGGKPRDETFKFAFSRQGDGLVFSGGPEDMIFFNVKRDGAFIAAFADPFPLRGTFMGTLGFGELDVRGEGIAVNLPALWQFVRVREEFDITSGIAVGSLQIRGPMENPEFYGKVQGENLRMRVPRFLSADIVPIDMSLVFDGDEISFTDTAASCGKGLGVVNGKFLLEKWVPVSFSINVSAPVDRPLPFKFDIGGILARGITSGALNISMADSVLGVSGDLLAQETEISLNASEITASQAGDAWGTLNRPVVVNIVVTAGKKVEFLWPAREFPVLQAYADMGTKARIFVNSLDRSFAFTGDVKLRSGEVFYFERSFYIRSGMLSFREDQNHFDPRISIRAEVRDRASNGPVTISMVVNNAPLQSFVPRFESSPALSQTEILSLLGQNFVGAAGEDGSVSNPFLSSSADLLAQSQVMRRVQGALRDLLHLDMFSVRTQFIQRAAFGFMGIQEQPVDRIGWVGNYFDNTSVFIGKYIGSEMFAQAMVSLRYDEKKRTFGGYTFEPDFGIELRSPLGNIRWNLVPTHPENWYLDDCSFTISWNFSF